MKKTEIISACAIAVICVFASATKIKANTYTDNNSYTVTIPTEVVVDTDTQQADLNLDVQLETYSNLEVSISSEHGYYLVNKDNSQRRLSYSISDDDKQLVFSNPMSDETNNSKKNQTYSIGIYVNESTNISGEYTDRLTFTLSGENYTSDTEKKRHKLIFNTNDGSVYTESKWVEDGSAYGILPVPKRDGYHFDGWYTEAEDGKKVGTDTTMGDADTTIYAHWTANTLTIKYHNDGAEIIHWEDREDNVLGQDVTSFSVEEYGKVFSNGGSGLYDVWRWKKTGYSTKGNRWKIGKDGSEEYDDHKGFSKAEDCAEYLGVLDQFKKGNVVVDLYPIWIANKYTIKYVGNGSNVTGSTTSSIHTYDVEQNLTSNGFSREGYVFVGWNTKADGSGVKYEDKESVVNLTATANGTVTLYAQWKANSSDSNESDTDTMKTESNAIETEVSSSQEIKKNDESDNVPTEEQQKTMISEEAN